MDQLQFQEQFAQSELHCGLSLYKASLTNYYFKTERQSNNAIYTARWIYDKKKKNSKNVQVTYTRFASSKTMSKGGL